MVALGIIVVIALLVAFFILDRRNREPNPTSAARPEADTPLPEVATPERVERDIYRSLYADRSGDVSRQSG